MMPDDERHSLIPRLPAVTLLPGSAQGVQSPHRLLDRQLRIFFPKPIGLLDGEEKHPLAEGHVSHQPLVAAARVVPEAGFGLGQPERVFDPRPRKGDLRQREQRRARWR